MSLRVMKKVWESDAGPAASRLVLLALADFADDSGRAWPSIATLAAKCGISARSVNRCLSDLERDGYLTREARFNQSNVYVVNPSPTPDRMSPPDTLSPPDRMSVPPCQDVTPPPDNVGALTTNRTIKEPSHIDKQIDKDALFEQWWKIYPRKKSKGQAEKAYRKALKLTDHDTLVSGAAAYAKQVAGKDPEFTAYGSTWLNGKRWLDEDIAPATTETVDEWLRDCWTNYDTQSIETRSGLRFDPPDIPADVTDARGFNLAARRQWITEHRQEITNRILTKETAAA